MDGRYTRGLRLAWFVLIVGAGLLWALGRAPEASAQGTSAPTTAPGTPTAGQPGVGAKSAVLVIDGQALYRQLHWDEALADQASEDRQAAQKQVDQLKAYLEKLVEDKKRALGKDVGKVDQVLKTTDLKEMEKLLSVQQIADLRQTIFMATNTLQQANNGYVQLIAQRQQEMNKQFREALEPEARRAGEEMGAAIVAWAESLIYFNHDPSVDITNKVANRVSDARLVFKHLPPMPTINFEPGATTQPSK